MLDGSYRLQSFTLYSQLSSRLTIFGLQKQASFSWRLIYADYYPLYNLAGKSNSTFSSKIIASMGLIEIRVSQNLAKLGGKPIRGGRTGEK